MLEVVVVEEEDVVALSVKVLSNLLPLLKAAV